MVTLISAVFVFFMVILFHEFGHFIVAKVANIKVNEFSIGMGPKIFQVQKGETKYSIKNLCSLLDGWRILAFSFSKYKIEQDAFNAMLPFRFFKYQDAKFESYKTI